MRTIKKLLRVLDDGWYAVMTFVFGCGFAVSATSAVASYNWMLKTDSLLIALPCFLLLAASVLFASFFFLALATDFMLRMTGGR